MEFGRGALKSGICEPRFTADLIPVDVVANALLTAAWHTTIPSPRELNIYNCTSGDINQITWGKFVDHIKRHAVAYPSKYVTSYPNFTPRTNRTTHAIAHFFQHIIPAYLQDIALYITGGRPM
uniref:Fatty acyl-CoA reductase n=1 Tax=Photinus pyralis TaxID=7054 RepID=A0A1Y1L096_PHOPY